MGEGKFWEKILRGRKEETPAETPAKELNIEADLELIDHRLFDPENTEEKVALTALERILEVAENNERIQKWIMGHVKNYKEYERGEAAEESENAIKNGLLYEKMIKWQDERTDKKRLGKYYELYEHHKKEHEKKRREG